MSKAHPPNPKRFDIFTELKDGSGFTIKGTEFVFKYDRFSGWYDEYGNYYNSKGVPEDPPSDSDHEDHLQHSDGPEDHEGDEFQRQFGGPKNYYDEDEEDVYYQKIAFNLSMLNQYPTGKPFRVNFKNIAYISKREEVFDYFQKKVGGLINVIFLENERRQFNGNGYFVVQDLKAGAELIKLEGEKYNGREVHFSVVEVEEFLQDPLENEELYPDFQKHKSKNYTTKGKPSAVREEVKQEKLKAQPQVQPKVTSKIQTKVESEPKVVHSPEDFFTYKFLKTAFPMKSSFKEWIDSHKFDHEKDIKKVEKIEGDESYAWVTMKKKVCDKLNDTFYNGKKIVFELK